MKTTARPKCQFVSVYDRITFKCKEDFTELTGNERTTLEDMIIEDTAVYVTRVSDQKLMELAIERGVIL